MATSTIRINFGNTTSTGATIEGHLSAEIDSRANGLNGGKNAFLPGESVAILVYKTDNVVISGVEVSSGSIAPSGTTTVTIDSDLVFADAIEASLEVPALSAPTVTWFGNSLGSVTLNSDKVTVRASHKGVAVARATYASTAHVYYLQSPASINGSTEFSIVVVITGQAT